MDLNRLKTHIKLCKKNLLSNRVKCCAACPFEEEITKVYPEFLELFFEKREKLKDQLWEEADKYAPSREEVRTKYPDLLEKIEKTLTDRLGKGNKK